MEPNKEEWVLVEEAPGPIQAEILRGLLESNGIEAHTSMEGAWDAYPSTFGMLGMVQLLVRQSDLPLAQEVIKEYYAGDFIDPDANDESPETED